MSHSRFPVAIFALACALPCCAQLANQVDLKIDSSNRTLSVSAQEQVSVEPDLAILHIGFETPPSDAKTAYATGAQTSNQIVSALKQASVPEISIRSESQRLESWDNNKSHKFKLVQFWTVRVPPARAAEILDVAVTAGATDSGDIEWTVEDEKALENKALEQATERARADAAVLAKGMGVQLGKLLYVTNQVSGPQIRPFATANFGVRAEGMAAPPLAIEPHKVSRNATVYAVFAVE